MHAILFVLVSTLAASILLAEAPKSEASRSTTAPASPITAALAVKPLITQEMIDGWIRTWQNRLGLYEWTVEARIVRVKELPKNAVANIRWSLSTKRATVRVLDPADSNLRASEIVKDTELSVVHELVHLSMAKLPLDPNHTELEEETVKRLSVALLNLDKPEAR